VYGLVLLYRYPAQGRRHQYEEESEKGRKHDRMGHGSLFGGYTVLAQIHLGVGSTIMMIRMVMIQVILCQTHVQMHLGIRRRMHVGIRPLCPAECHHKDGDQRKCKGAKTGAQVVHDAGLGLT